MASSMIYQLDEGRSNTITEPLHFLLFPFMASGHMIPMLDLARLLAARGIRISFFTTPIYLARIRHIADRATATSLPIRFVELRFPATEAGVAGDCEAVDFLSSIDHMYSFMNAMSLFRDSVEAYLQNSGPDQWPKPDCLISDNIHYWTAEVAQCLRIPRLIFHGPSCFYLLCSRLIDKNRSKLEAALKVASGGAVAIPGLPHSILVGMHDVRPAWHASLDQYKSLKEKLGAAEESAEGVIANTFNELEPWYFMRFHEMIGKPVWNVGPVSLYKEEADDKAARGQVSTIDNRLLLKWLNGKEVGSVVMVSFGTTFRNPMAQIVELGHGLEASGQPFVWVVKEVELLGLEKWMPEFEKRVVGRGMVIRGWAPQALMLGHEAIGGFMTHCGWNSILEAITGGLVLATWPHSWDQFLNERLVVDVLKIGVFIGAEDRSKLAVKNSKDVDVDAKVSRWEVEEAVKTLMNGGEECGKRRERAKQFGLMARRAMEEGGSSWEGLKNVISYVEMGKKSNPSNS